jgi:O-glycosyl hydrolase
MRRIFGIVLCHQLASTTLFGATLMIRVDPRVAYQAIDGFGASDAWQCAIVGQNWPEGKRQRIADLLFSRDLDAQGNPRGIGLSIWRFNVGAGTAEQGDSRRGAQRASEANPREPGDSLPGEDRHHDERDQCDRGGDRPLQGAADGPPERGRESCPSECQAW